MATGGETRNVFALNVNGIIVTGTGTSEDEAKKDALKQISFIIEHEPAASSSQSVFSPGMKSKFGARNDVFENMVGKLQEFCHAKGWPLPTYTLEKIQGQSHLPIFSIKCKVLGFAAIGSGSSKKQAKQNAANMVFCSIKKSADEDGHTESQYKNNLHPVCLSSSSPYEKEKATSKKEPLRQYRNTFSLPYDKEKATSKKEPLRQHRNTFLSSSSPYEKEKATSKKEPLRQHRNTLMLPYVGRTTSSEEKALTLKELQSTDIQSAEDLCGSAEKLSIPSTSVVLSDEGHQEMSAEKQLEQPEEISESENPSSIDDLSVRLHKMFVSGYQN